MNRYQVQKTGKQYAIIDTIQKEAGQSPAVYVVEGGFFSREFAERGCDEWNSGTGDLYSGN